MATTKTALLDALNDLLERESKEFKWHLSNGDNPIPRGRLEKADRQDVVDIMVQHYGKADAGKIAVRVLRSIKHNELADQLKRKLQEEDVSAGDGASSSGIAVTAQTAGVTVNIKTSDGGTVKAPVLHGGVFNGPVNFS